MSGRLIISHHKSYHVWKRENIERVERDEREAAEKEAAVANERLQREKELRLARLRGEPEKALSVSASIGALAGKKRGREQISGSSSSSHRGGAGRQGWRGQSEGAGNRGRDGYRGADTLTGDGGAGERGRGSGGPSSRGKGSTDSGERRKQPPNHGVVNNFGDLKSGDSEWFRGRDHRDRKTAAPPTKQRARPSRWSGASKSAVREWQSEKRKVAQDPL